MRRQRIGALALAAALFAAVLPLAGPAGAAGTFSDDDGNIHEANIETLAANGITQGCNPPQNNLFCPGESVTRAQMATFLVRALDLTPLNTGPFTDISGSVHKNNINALYAEGITQGCNPPANTRYCPDSPVTRAQMATFLTRALDYTPTSNGPFTDISGSVHKNNINALYAEGVTQGCNPPTNTQYCPDNPVTRAQMATFLVRALDLTNPNPTSTSTTSTTSTTTTTTTIPSDGIELLVTSDPDRHNARPLDGARLSGNIYVAADIASAGQVRFWIDDEDMSGPPTVIDTAAPWDLGGTETGTGRALAWNTAVGTSSLGEGDHTIRVVATSGGNVIASSLATFRVDNDPPTNNDQAYLSWVGDAGTTMTVVWRTQGADQIRWAPAGTTQWTTMQGSTKTSGVGSGALSVAEIDGLSPDHDYVYQVARDGGGWSASRSFATAPAPDGSLDFVYMADTGLSGRLDGLGVGTLQTVTAIEAIDPDLLLVGGDYAYNATGTCQPSDGRYETDTTGLNQAIDQWFEQMAPLVAEIPTMPTYGNHEVLLCEGFPAWADRFATPSGVGGPSVSPDPAVDARGTYSFDAGPVHFISIMAVRESAGLSTTQFDWLESDIESARDAGAQWIIPYFHATPISHGTNHTTNAALRNQLAPLFEANDIPLVLFSHDQSFERTHPIVGLAGGDPTATQGGSCYSVDDGVVWLKTSPAGKHSNRSESFSRWGSTLPAWIAASDNTMHHFTRVTATPGSLRVRTYGLDGLGSPSVIKDDFRITESGNCGL